jgi:hypothetical protein
MGDVSVKVGLNAARTMASIELVGDEQQALSAGLSANEVEAIIRALATVREQMTPEIPKVPEGQISTPMDPLWQIPADQNTPEKTLLLRHPGLGWLGFYLPRWSSSAIAKALLTGSEPAPPPPPFMPMGQIPLKDDGSQTKS